MIRHDRLHAIEPEPRDLREDSAFVGDTRPEDVIERRDAIGRDDEQAIAEIVNVSDFARAVGFPGAEAGCEYWSCEKQGVSFVSVTES